MLSRNATQARQKPHRQGAAQVLQRKITRAATTHPVSSLVAISENKVTRYLQG